MPWSSEDSTFKPDIIALLITLLSAETYYTLIALTENCSSKFCAANKAIRWQCLRRLTDHRATQGNGSKVRGWFYRLLRRTSGVNQILEANAFSSEPSMTTRRRSYSCSPPSASRRAPSLARPTRRRPKSPFLLSSFKHHRGRYLHAAPSTCPLPCAYIFMRR